MTPIEQRVAREAKAMTRQEVFLKAIEGRITWLQAADILGMTPRHLLRLRKRYSVRATGAFVDGRAGRVMRKRIGEKTIRELLRLKKDLYADYSVKHFHEHVTEKHKLKVSYTYTLALLQSAGLAEKGTGRGTYRRKRERRPMTGMLLHLDASMHEWLPGLAKHDLVVMLDDADGKVLFARFFEQESTASTLHCLMDVLTGHGRFCELYTDRGSHFCRTPEAGGEVDGSYNGQVPRALKALGIRHILARSPQARGRSERAFGTFQGRLPQELRVADVHDYTAANEYLQHTFIADFNRRFTVKPAQRESAFSAMSERLDLEMLLSTQHERVVRNDSTVIFESLLLQLPKGGTRLHYVRCPVLVHQFINETLGISYQGDLLARYRLDGSPIPTKHPSRLAA